MNNTQSAQPPQNQEATAQNHYWSIPINDLFAKLGSSPQGLDQTEAQRRVDQYGENTLQARKRSSAWQLLLNQFKSPIMLILLFATGVSAFLKDWVDAVIILLIVLGSSVLSFVQEYQAGNAIESLRSQITLTTKLRRGGKEQTVPTTQVVPGDVVVLSAGSLIPADAVMIEARDFFVNQAVLTGETYPVEKTTGQVPAKASLAERTNTIYFGTNVRSGNGLALVVKTGKATAFGQIANRLNLRPPETEFERGIRKLGAMLTEIMFVLVLLNFGFNVYFNKPVLDSLLFSIALAVGLTPQLLPAIININLSKGAQRMAAKGVIVRRLEAIENFGSMDILCTDKTGTITVGVVQLDDAMDAQGQPSDEVFLAAYENAHFQTGLTNPLDEAILAKSQPDIQSVEKIDEIPYDFKRKRLSIIVCETGKLRMVTKGALDMVLQVCSQVRSDGQTLPLDTEQAKQIDAHYQEWSAQGYRVLGVAEKPLDEPARVFTRDDEKDLTFIGFLLFLDPPKEGIDQVIRQLNQLKVNLKIITGDNPLVARHVAELIGLGSSKIMTGDEVDELSEAALRHAVENTTLFAEVDPNQKERIILSLKKNGHVVGYMGDGINDAPSIHDADVGISVNNAVDVAKQAADFVLLKNDLGVLQQGIIQGRMTFANTLKYVFMATSANFGNMFSMTGASLLMPFLPMLPKQILLINFMTDFPEMAIASDRVDQAFIEAPHRWDVAFIRRFLVVFGLMSSVFDYLTFFVLLWVMKANEMTFHTGWFVESVVSATLIVFVLRTRLPFFRSQPSRVMMVATGLVILATLIIPYSPLAGVLGFTPLPPLFLLAMAAIVLAYITSVEITKRWFFRKWG